MDSRAICCLSSTLREPWDSNPGRLDEKSKRYICAKLSPFSSFNWITAKMAVTKKSFSSSFSNCFPCFEFLCCHEGFCCIWPFRINNNNDNKNNRSSKNNKTSCIFCLLDHCWTLSSLNRKKWHNCSLTKTKRVQTKYSFVLLWTKVHQPNLASASVNAWIFLSPHQSEFGCTSRTFCNETHIPWKYLK